MTYSHFAPTDDRYGPYFVHLGHAISGEVKKGRDWRGLSLRFKLYRYRARARGMYIPAHIRYRLAAQKAFG